MVSPLKRRFSTVGQHGLPPPQERFSRTIIDAQPVGDPVKDELVRKRRVVDVILRSSRIGTAEYFQRSVALIRLDLTKQRADVVCLKPAMLAHGDQQRTLYAATGSADIEPAGEDMGIPGFAALCKEFSLVQIPDTPVTNRGREAIIESDPPCHERARTVSENRYSRFINIVPGRETIHDMANRGFQIGAAD